MMVKVRDLTRWTRLEISHAFKKARKIVSRPELDIRRAPVSFSADTILHGRILIVTPKKVGSAPQRNLVRRRLKALFYEQEWYQQPWDLLIFVKPSATALSINELGALLARAYATSASQP